MIDILAKVNSLFLSAICHQETLTTINIANKEIAFYSTSNKKKLKILLVICILICTFDPNMKKEEIDGKRIAVLLSGGVDSAVVVHQLVELGLKPDCFYIKIGPEEE